MENNEIYNDLKNAVNKIEMRRRELQSMQMKADKEIVDLYHFLEFNNFSASMGYKMAKMLKDSLIRRRAAKNELETIKIIFDHKAVYIANGETDKLLQKVKDKHYTPRILNELFKEQ